ncbi:MAG TPA: sulfatase-like hydrolase/transferase [Myxococcaceae bacterium]|nr:sulfatase-like hydrolase/transferase [Myxococcaceae bacterium]
MLSLVGASRPEWRREIGLRVTLALLPCAVLVVSLRTVLGAFPIAWLVPLAMTFGSALMVVSLAREVLGRRGFLVFWAMYGLAWTAVAWHGTHFHRAPRPAALFMNLEEISQVPLPGWHEVPLAFLIAVLGLGALARKASPRGRDLRLATIGTVGLCAVLQGYAFLRYQTRDMLRYSEYRDLVRTHGLEGAVTLDALEILRSANSGSALAELRRDASENPARPLPLDPVRVNRMVLVQVESLDRDALTVAPVLTGIWQTATHGLVTSDRTSVSGSSSADFQVLTGLRARSGVPVYRLGWDGAGQTLPDHAAALGFRFHAYHGNDRNFWNRGPFFSAIHASFHSAESIPESEFSRWGRADGDLFRFAAARIRQEQRAVHFLITLSTHAPYDLIIPPGPLERAPVKTRYLASVSYADAALGKFLHALPRDGTTLVALYGDHTSGLFEKVGADEPPVPLMLGTLAPDGSLAPLSARGQPIQELPGTYELPALHRFVQSCLDASAP